jgi:hypothetical protein
LLPSLTVFFPLPGILCFVQLLKPINSWQQGVNQSVLSGLIHRKTG